MESKVNTIIKADNGDMYVLNNRANAVTVATMKSSIIMA